MGLFIKRLIIITSTLLIITCAIFLLYTVLNTPPLNLDKLNSDTTSFIYDKNDNLIYTLGDKITNHVKYDEISKYMIDAIVSTEDERFYLHKGLDYKRIASSAINNIKKLEFDEGASTITQQLVKNVYLSNDKTISRKIKEMILAKRLEKKLTKKEILESYLNNILFGKRIYGINSASIHYFNKPAKDLNILESSILTSLIQLPNLYSKNMEALNNRKNIVLKKMYEKNYITYDEYIENKEIIIEKLNSYISNDSKYYSYIDIVLDELDNLNIDPYKSELKIYTNLDTNIQNEISDIFKNKYNHFKSDKLNCGIVCMDKNGLIEAVGGSRNDTGINYAKIPLQPGSTIKPILDYGPAFEYLGYTPSTIILDNEETYSNGTKIKNFDNKYLGEISLRESLRLSRNIPSLKLFKQLNNKSFEFSEKIGITLNEDLVEAMCIGGFKDGYSVLDMTNAYMAFSNMGYYSKGKTIRKINDTSFTNPSIKAMKSETAYFINSILHDVIKSSPYNIKNNYMCAKTGQTNYDYITKRKYNIPNYGVKDSWYIGYNDQKTIGVWCGYDNLNYYLTPDTKNTPRQIFKSVFEKYNITSHQFKKPDSLVKLRYYYDNEYYYSDEFNISYKERYDYFYKNNLPKDRWIFY